MVAVWAPDEPATPTTVSVAGLPAATVAEKPAGISSAAATLLSATFCSASDLVTFCTVTTSDFWSCAMS